MDTEYIHEINSIQASDGEIYMSYENDKTLVFNVINLFKDLPNIIDLVCKENKKEQERILLELKTILDKTD